MTIEVVPYTHGLIGRVAEFNQRMRTGATGWGWYQSDVDTWVPPRPGQRVWREHYLALEDGEAVRGAYALKPQDWYFRGEPRLVADWQGPVSEGLLSPKYNTLGLRLLRDMLRRYPLLYSWGHGADDGPILQMLGTLRWVLHPTPFCLRVEKPYRFLRLNRYLRDSPKRTTVLDALAFSGVGWAGLKSLQGGLSLRRSGGSGAEAAVVSSFGPWADELWERCASSYQVIALRDSATMNALLPSGGWPGGIALRITRAGQDLGWAVVMDTEMSGDPRFGDLHVGSIVDCLCPPEDAGAVVRAASRFLRRRGVDIICSNQAHPAWARAFSANGFIVLPKRRFFVASPELQKAMEPFEETCKGLHLTNMDGHGPHGF